MSRTGKIRQRLEAVEASFRADLVKGLTACAAGRKDLLFAAREFLPAGYPKCLRTELADDLLAEAEVIRGLRGKLGEPFRGSLAAEYAERCREWADMNDAHRGSAKTIAQKLLARLGDSAAG